MRSCRLLSFILVLSMLLSLVMITPVSAARDYSVQNGAFIFNSEESLSLISNPHSLSITYDETFKGLKLTVNSSQLDPQFLLDFGALGINLSADEYKYFVVTYMVPGSVSAKATKCEVFLSSGDITVPTAGVSSVFALNCNSVENYQMISLANRTFWKGDIHSVRFDCFSDCVVGDTMYLDSIILCKDRADAETVKAERAEARKSGMNEGGNLVIPEDYLCTSYQWKKYTSPFWKGEIVYNEAVYPIMDKNGNAEYTLMYEPEHILSVNSATFDAQYTEGFHYTVSGNKIKFLNTMPLKTWNSLHNDTGSSWKRLDGQGYERSSHLITREYINVTYTHKDTWGGPVPANSSSKLPVTSQKITNKGDLNIVYYGDSLCGGARASSYENIYPYAEWWNYQISTAIREGCGVNVSAEYSSVGGSTATSMAESANINKYIIPYNPDLVVIEFGVNDSQNYSAGRDSVSQLRSEFADSVKTIINKVRASYPNCEFLVITPYYSQTNLWRTEYFDACQAACFDVEKTVSGVAVADVLAVHKYLLDSGKVMEDFTGDNLCHPNDYMMRIYSQVCLEAIVPGGIAAYVPNGEIVEKDPSGDHTHSFGDWQIIKPANCVEEGLKARSCSCGEKETEIIPKNGAHVEGEPVVTPATCTENGSIKTSCALCGWSIADVPIQATGHKFVSGVCTVCGEVDPDYIAGDIDLDGKVTAKDVNVLKKSLSGTENLTGTAADAADVNGDGKVTVADINLLKKKVTGEQ